MAEQGATEHASEPDVCFTVANERTLPAHSVCRPLRACLGLAGVHVVTRAAG